MADITVTNTNDSGAGSLRQAIIDATAGQEIDFSVTGTITLTSGELAINKDLTITGPGADTLSVSGNNSSRIFNVSGAGVDVTISSLTVTNGYLNGGDNNGGGGILNNLSTLTLINMVITNNEYERSGAARGGGVSNVNGGSLTLTDCTVSLNTVRSTTSGSFKQAYGGGVNSLSGSLSLSGCVVRDNNSTTTFSSGTGYSGGVGCENGTATIEKCAIFDNTASDNGGGIGVLGGTMIVTNSTLSGNSAAIGGGILNNATLTLNFVTVANNSLTGSGQGGGLKANSGTATIDNSIISDNTDTGGADDVDGTVTDMSETIVGDSTGLTITNDLGGNLLDTDPQLGVLTEGNGTWFYPITEASLAFNSAVCGLVTEDQRGVSRPQGATCDIGAYEFVSIDIEVTPLTQDFGSVIEGESSQRNVIVNNNGATYLTVSSLSITGDDADQFSITSGGSTPIEIREDGMFPHTVTLQFSPESNGSKSAILNIVSDDPDEPTVQVSLVGEGLSAGGLVSQRITLGIEVSDSADDFHNNIIYQKWVKNLVG